MNALGRLDDANSMVELLTTTDMGRARILALELEGMNAQRKLLSDQVYQAAQAQLTSDPKLLDYPGFGAIPSKLACRGDRCGRLSPGRAISPPGNIAFSSSR